MMIRTHTLVSASWLDIIYNSCFSTRNFTELPIVAEEHHGRSWIEFFEHVSKERLLEGNDHRFTLFNKK